VHADGLERRLLRRNIEGEDGEEDTTDFHEQQGKSRGSKVSQYRRSSTALPMRYAREFAIERGNSHLL